MKIAVFSAKSFDREFLCRANLRHGHDLLFIEAALTAETAPLAEGCVGVCPFVHDRVTGNVIGLLAAGGTRLLTLRSAGFNHVDLPAAARHGIVVARVPAYSPYAIAELAVGLILSLDRKIHLAWQRSRRHDFSLEGLLGFDLHGKTVGVIGTGNIGSVLCRIMVGFGCRVIAHDLVPNPEMRSLGVSYVGLDDLLTMSDVISLHVPLTPETRHLIDDRAIGRMKRGVMLINTSRGAAIDTHAVVRGLEAGRIGALGLDVYDGEEDIFFRDLSGTVIRDTVFTRLLELPNVLVTGHRGFFTEEALTSIAETTLANATAFEGGTGDVHVAS